MRPFLALSMWAEETVVVAVGVAEAGVFIAWAARRKMVVVVVCMTMHRGDVAWGREAEAAWINRLDVKIMI